MAKLRNCVWEFEHKYSDEIKEAGLKKATETKQINKVTETRNNTRNRRTRIIFVSAGILIVLIYLFLPVFISLTKYEPLTKNLPLITQPRKLISDAADRAVYEVTKPVPGPCLLFTASVCGNAKAFSPNSLAVAFRIPSGTTLFAPTDGKFALVYKNGSVFLSANSDNSLPFPGTDFKGSNGSYYSMRLLGKWNFVLSPPEQGNHTYKKGEALATLMTADGYIAASDGLPANEYNFVVIGKSSAYMTPFLEK